MMKISMPESKPSHKWRYFNVFFNIYKIRNPSSIKKWSSEGYQSK
jgi:hypothetical protein